MGKNKTGIMAAISAAAQDSAGKRAHPALPKGTIGSVRAGLGGIQEIDPDLILPWGPDDRMELTAVHSVEELAQSIAEVGQQVPVLLRPAEGNDGKFEVIYGRRRILACREAGVRVKALIRTMDDGQALMAKGLENANRSELSFYERARFAEAILAQGYSRAEAMQALSISKNSLSQLERITRLVPSNVGDAIGPAPGAGRPKWMALAEAFEKGRGKGVLNAVQVDLPSDDRMELALRAIRKRGATGTAPVREPVSGVEVKATGAAVTVKVSRKGAGGFAEWLEDNLDEILKNSHERFQRESPGG